MKVTRIFLLVLAFFSCSFILNAQDIECNLQDLETLPWVQELLSTQNCECNQSLEYRCNGGEGILVYGPKQPNNCADYQTFYYDLEGNVLCIDGGFTGGNCTQFPELLNSNLIKTVSSCQTNNQSINCTCSEIIDQDWILDLIENNVNDCLEKVDLVTYEGNTALLFDASAQCNAVDFSDVLYDCDGNIICSIGFVLPENRCTEATTFVQNIWNAENGFNDGCGDTNELSDCTCSEIIDEAWILNLTGQNANDCLEKVDLVSYKGQTAVLFDAFGGCNASDAPDILYDCKGNQICLTWGFAPPENLCTESTTLIQNIWNAENGYSDECKDTKETNCTCSEIVDKAWILNLLGDEVQDCIEKVDLVTYEGSSAILFDGKSECNNADYPDILYDCDGNIICLWGFVLPEDRCDGTPVFKQNIWHFETGFNAECSETNGSNAICGIDDVYEIPFLEHYVDNCNYDAIYAFKIEEKEYIYVVADGFCEYPDGTFSQVADLPSVLYDCEGNIICQNGAFTPDIDSYCSTQGINVNSYLEPSNIIWKYEDNNESGFCGTDNIADLPFLQSYIDNCYYINIYSFAINGQEAIYAQSTNTCIDEDGTPIVISDLGSVLLDCEGNYICNSGGFTPLEAQCSFQGYDISPYLTPENLIWSADNNDNEENICLLNANVCLQGACANSTDNLMRDDLRIKGVIPMNEPFTTLPDYQHAGDGGGEKINPSVLMINNNSAIIDWVLIELHDSETNILKATSSALMQRDGDIVDTDGVSPVAFNVPDGDYRVTVRHRNHLGVTTKNALTFVAGTPANADFNTIETYGEYALMDLPNGKKAMWGGCAANGQIIFQGPGNIPNIIFFDVLNAPNNDNYAPNFIYEGAYNNTDLDMSGETIFQGNNNDVNFAFFTILMHPGNQSLQPNFIINEQKP